MPYVIFAALGLALLVAATVIRRMWTGNRLVTSLLTGEFDQSQIGRQFAAWFNERPERSEQRIAFVQIASRMGCSSGMVADRLMTCIMKAWRESGFLFGEALVQELELMIVFDSPTTPEQIELQQKGLAAFATLKERLRLLDGDGK